MLQLLEYAGILEPFRNLIKAPEDLELVVREKDGRQYLFLLNYQPHPVTFTLKAEMKELYNGEIMSAGEHILSALGTCCMEIPSSLTE